MTTKTIRHKLYHYLRVAEGKKVKAIYTILAEAIKKDYDYWNEKAFVEALDKRSVYFKAGKVKGFPWKKTKAQITV